MGLFDAVLDHVAQPAGQGQEQGQHDPGLDDDPDGNPPPAQIEADAVQHGNGGVQDTDDVHGRHRQIIYAAVDLQAGLTNIPVTSRMMTQATRRSTAA